MSNLNYQSNINRKQASQLEEGPGKRRILHFRSSSIHSFFLDGLEGDGWIPFVTDNPRKAEQLLNNGQVFVGVIEFDQWVDEKQFEEISALLAFKGINWVALIPNCCGENEKIWQLIGDRFFDYHRLPIDIKRLLVILGHAHGMARLAHRLAGLQTQRVGDDPIVGNSQVMQQLKCTVTKIANVDAPVLIAGESGTGKELVAHAVHDLSSRRSRPFEAVNCGALPAGLIQSELFGHEKGAFTGASGRKIGRFESANGGTIFLDEIGDLSYELQIVLLRILEQKVVRRVGGTKDIPVNVRVVAATHIDLECAVKEKRFREDLYYRLNVLRVKTPPLREREDDVELLALYYLKEFSEEMGCSVRGFTVQALKAMRNYNWPGNVRELINCIQQATALCDKALISPEELGCVERRSSNRTSITLDSIRAKSEKKTIISALRSTGDNISLAALELAISRATLYRLIKKYEILV